MLQQRVSVQHNYSLDALRVLALLGVFFYHLSARTFPYAYLGVVGFFGLAGYLSLRKVILQEYNRLQRPGLGSRLYHKLAKLYPPLLLFLLVLSLVMVLLFPSFLDNFVGQMRSTLLSCNNIWQIIHGESYFEGQGYLKPLTHMWSLSLEIQFYLFFILFVESFYQQRDRKPWRRFFGLLTVFSFMLLLFLYDGSGDPTRVYYGPDTRLFSFSLGAIAALIAEPGRARSRVKRAAKNLVLAILWPILLIAYFLPLTATDMIRYGLFAYSLLFALIMGLAADDESFLHGVGKSKPVQYLCRRSYLIYLWHYPCFAIVERLAFGRHWPAILLICLQIGTALGLAEIAYQIDQALRKLTKRHLTKKLAAAGVETPAEKNAEATIWPERLRAGQAVLLSGPATQAQKQQAMVLKFKTRQHWLDFCLMLLLLAAMLALPWQAIYELRGGSDFRKLEKDLVVAESSLAAMRESKRQNLSNLSTPETAQIDTAQEREAQTASSSDMPPDIPTELTTDWPEQAASQLVDAEVSESGGSGIAAWWQNFTASFQKGSAESNSNKESGMDIDPYKLIGELELPSAQPVAEDDWLAQDSLNYIEEFNQTTPELYLDLEQYFRYRDVPVTIIGDSVSVINSYHIYGYLPQLELDALSNRQMHEVWDIYSGLKQDGLVGEILVVALGSNGDIDTDTLELVWKDMEDKPLLLVNIVLPYSITEAERNLALANFVEQHEGVYLIDWCQAAMGHPEYFQEDLIHPNDYGCKAYSQLITKSIVDLLTAYENAGLLAFFQAD